MIGQINDFLSAYPEIQAIVVISCISAIGIALGKIKVAGVSLGVTFVFFVGILAGHLGLEADAAMLSYAESFGLVIFVYALGLQVGPGFFSSLREGGVRLNVQSLLLIVAGTALALALIPLSGIKLPDMVGALCGATTNTPALAAAQQTLEQMGRGTSGAALSCAVTYPLGVVGVILVIVIARRLPVSKRRAGEDNDAQTAKNRTYIAELKIVNPGVDGMRIVDIPSVVNSHFVISRLWRDGDVIIPIYDTRLKLGDHVLVITTESDRQPLVKLFGEQEDKDWNRKNIDWNKIDSHLISQRLVVTRPEINGKKLGDLRLRNHYGVNITRIYRAGVQLLATSDLRLQMGDKLTVVGERASVRNVESVIGNAIKSLKEPNLITIFIGIIIGLLFGIIPISFPGMGNPIRLGLAGGPIVAGILIGAFGPRIHMVTYTTRSVNLMLRAFGLAVYLACLGLDAGRHFFETVVCVNGLILLGCGLLITFVPVLMAILLLTRYSRTGLGTIYGMVCGCMANPMALDYVNSTSKGDKASVAYATVYPLAMFARVIISQLLLILLL